jgi:putative FmdB family regulatory protein
MPVFEYRCEDCGNRFDAFFRSAGDAEGERPACGGSGSRRVRKLFSVIGLGRAESPSKADDCGARST